MRSSKFLSVTAVAAVVAAMGVAQGAQFECQTAGAFPPVGGPGDCEGATGTLAFVVAAGCAVGMPSTGIQAAQVSGNGFSVTPNVLARPIGPGISELRIPMPAGTGMVTFDWQWQPGETFWGDGVDVSVCDAAGNRLALCVNRNDSQDGACTAVTTSSTSFAATPPGAYLSAVAYNYSDTFGDPLMWLDNVRFVSACYEFECQAAGPIPAIGGPGDCEGATGQNASVVAAGCGAGMPSNGAQAARVVGDGWQVALNSLTRPLAPGGGAISELRMPLPTGTQAVSFDWQWLPGETFWGDGVDISVCDAAGNLLTLCVARNDSQDSACTPVAFVNTLMAPTPAGAYLSAVAFNRGDTTGDPTLWIDHVKASQIPPFEIVFSSSGPGTLRVDVNYGLPNSVYLAPITLAPGAFPNGWFYGIDISISDLFAQVSIGAPFIGLLDGVGHFGLPATGTYFTVPSGLTLYSVALNDLAAPNVAGNTLSTPVGYTVP